MSWRRTLIENLLRAVSFGAALNGRKASSPPRSIFVLRNNDIGDLLVVTPLFEALKRNFPQTRIIVGIGTWNRPVLLHNPWVDRVLEINAPWHNKQVCSAPHNSARGLVNSLNYILASPETAMLAQARCDVGIDVLGSPEGSLLMLRAGIPHRLGVKGYAGGDSAALQCVTFNPEEHVGRSALRFAEMLGAHELPECRPQLFPTSEEKQSAEQGWLTQAGAKAGLRRVVVAPGGGFVEKCWSLENYEKLLKLLAAAGHWQIAVVGGGQDKAAGARLGAIDPGVLNLTGKLSLRETFALMARADFAICNSSMLMHVAAAFRKPALVLLGESFDSIRQHRAQWGYPEQVFLGKEGRQGAPASVEEAMAAMIRMAGEVTG